MGISLKKALKVNGIKEISLNEVFEEGATLEHLQCKPTILVKYGQLDSLIIRKNHIQSVLINLHTKQKNLLEKYNQLDVVELDTRKFNKVYRIRKEIKKFERQLTEVEKDIEQLCR